ncbi:hypothetical protein [Heyndrickxia sporothermodurans]|uniref:Phage protein n=1 Tax=Heyndrickxia sporothermodurans TaxID=46224 RepID=A0AB37HES4_9BACI|nr:hypothetical protein [Heyndrickxia sporothermodurans]MBL5767991.1 hypothetical protein [Heyndrickxia sporothermodurans]MBL5771584.1 hypothetical protein [Heyndrickxia sporothermodurans]MBL5785870.1 hypothetical protein [Heyndrickxia sporothermodurans]MBL5789376.1 hypothetical protein [Heyndrickxia sporothermodurans]MBL5796628.1 hypothetical protein [Heyndrickxia sporothermodurans]
MAEKWTFNTDKDYWDFGSYDTKQEAIEQGRIVIKDEEPDHFYESSHFRIGKIVPVTMRNIDADMILEPIADDLYDKHEQAGENAFTKTTTEQTLDLERQLQDVFDGWIKKYDLDPTKGYFTVTEIEEIPFYE